MIRRHSPLAVAFLLAVALGLVLWLFPSRAWILTFGEVVRNQGWRGVAIFILAYIVGAAAIVPGSWLSLAAGLAYGPARGLLIASPASVAGATVAFLLARTVFRDRARRRLARYPRALTVDRAVQRRGLLVVLLLRLSPLFPFNVLNYALGLSSVGLGRYIVASFIGMLPATWMYVYLGSLAAIAVDLPSGDGVPSDMRMVLSVLGFAATVGLVVLGGLGARRALAGELGQDLPVETDEPARAIRA